MKACESERAQGWATAMKAGKPTYSPVFSSLADGILVFIVYFLPIRNNK